MADVYNRNAVEDKSILSYFIGSVNDCFYVSDSPKFRILMAST